MTTQQQHAPPLSIYEVHFTDPDGWLEELAKDLHAGEVEGKIVRLSVVQSSVTVGMLASRTSIQPGEDRPLPMSWARSRFVEASYISGRQQLVKLSAYAGFVWAEKGLERNATNGPAKNAETKQRERQLVARLQGGMRNLDVDIRTGGLYLEEGAWTAGPDRTIDAPEREKCATCGAEIYFANEAWRSRDSRQAEVFNYVTCRSCNGSGASLIGGLCMTCMGRKVQKQLDHLHDPEVEGRTV